MSSAFGHGYGRYYDLLYQDKDYAAECDMLEEIFRAYLDERPELILDASCGTGGHAKRGYRVVGVDAYKALSVRVKVVGAKVMCFARPRLDTLKQTWNVMTVAKAV